MTTLTDDERYMRMALDEAHRALARDEVPIGAVIVGGGRVVGRGHNLTETLTDVTAHAEMQAITAAAGSLGGKYLPDCTLYVTVEPCLMCAGALAWSQIGRVVYGAVDPKRGYHTYHEHPFHKKTVVQGGVLADECSQLMTEFFKKKRRQNPLTRIFNPLIRNNNGNEQQSHAPGVQPRTTTTATTATTAPLLQPACARIAANDLWRRRENVLCQVRRLLRPRTPK